MSGKFTKIFADLPIRGETTAQLVTQPKLTKRASATVGPCIQYGARTLELFGGGDPGDDPDQWIVEGVVPAGVPQMIAGHPKSMKTFIAEHQAISIAAGVDWLGRFKTRRGRVMVFPREDSVRETKRRLWRLAHGLGVDLDALLVEDWLRVEPLQPFYWTDKDHRRGLQRLIETWDPSLIILDSLSRTHTADENSVKEMLPVTNAWADISQATGVAISIIHHFVKSAKRGSGTLLQQLRGSGNIGATLRHIMGVEKPDGPVPFELSFGGNLHPLPLPFLVRVADDERDGRKLIRFEHAGDVGALALESADRARRDKTDKIDARVLSAVATRASGGEYFTRRGWRDRGVKDVPEKSIEASLTRLEDRGDIVYVELHPVTKAKPRGNNSAGFVRPAVRPTPQVPVVQPLGSGLLDGLRIGAAGSP